MGLFNKNNRDEEYLKVLGEIRDNLNTSISNDRFDTIIRSLEERIVSFKKDNENDLCGIDDTVNCLSDKVEELERTVKLQTKELDENYNLIVKQQRLIEKLTESYKLIHQDILKLEDNVYNPSKKGDNVKWEKIPTDEHFEVDKKKKDGIITAYNKKWKIKGQIHLENIVRMNEKGKFIGKSRNYTWDINNLIRLKKYMKQSEKYPTFTKLAKAVGVNRVNVVELGYYILNGDFDKYFNEWEQIQADNTFKKYGNWKPTIENNPEKRKEKGYV